MDIEIIILIISGAFICEFVNASMGMLYGTILSPVLIVAGFNPFVTIPSVLFSQAAGGLTASIFHHRFKNANFGLKSKNPKIIIKKIVELGCIESFKRGITKDLKVAFCITSLGIITIIIAILIAINISEVFLKTYIGILVLIMGVILLSNIRFIFSWKKILGVGILSAFNKGLSGGGFGPVVTSGQVISGRNGKNSIGSTMLAETPICFVGFLSYLITKGISDWHFIIFLTIGAVAAAPFGAFLTSKFKSDKKIKIILGILTIMLGVWALVKTWLL